MKLKDQVALVTGGGTGIGKAIAEEFLAEGASVVITGRREDVLEATVEEMGGRDGAPIAACPGDVAQAADIEAAVQFTEEKFGKLTIAVANAGVYGVAPVPEVDEADYDRIMDINLKGAFLTCKYAIPSIKSAGGGSIITIASSVSVKPTAINAVYGAAKAGVIYMTQVMALDHAKEGVRVNCISPAVVDTPIHPAGDTPEERKKYFDKMGKYHPLGRVGQPKEIARAAVYLCSQEASWVTGENLRIDGGLSLK